MTATASEQVPPNEDADVAAAGASPSETPPHEAETYAGAETVPTEVPPETSQEREGFGATWYNSKKITALWSINQNRNSWAYVQDVGWRRLADNSDSAVVALTMLSSHAQHTGVNANVLEDAGKITQLYVW